MDSAGNAFPRDSKMTEGGFGIRKGPLSKVHPFNTNAFISLTCGPPHPPLSPLGRGMG